MSDSAKPDASTIIYTLTDEAPALATRSLLPVIAAFAGASGVDVETRDISLANRILAAFSDLLPADQQRHDDLAELGELATRPEANIIKLPNISRRCPSSRRRSPSCRPRATGVPDYPDDCRPTGTAEETDVLAAAYAKVMGSAVNPVLREGNSDRRAPQSVKNFAQAPPLDGRMGPGRPSTRVITMDRGRLLRQRAVGHRARRRRAAIERHARRRRGTRPVLAPCPPCRRRSSTAR
jgi:isocitrate dehydrogenase